MATGDPTRVLVVDDDPQIRRILERALQKLQVEAMVVGDGESAAAALRDGGFTLVLIDMHLRGELGREVSLRLRALQAIPPRFVCVSGSISGPDGGDDAFDGFDSKPATVDELRELIGRWA
ncbi:MAG TPA: response regulator [Polyangiaceae bacterium]|jgi:two-component system KDP operon response regulator KdpE|nr:response regulator [Polyangiaceae bacterium]